MNNIDNEWLLFLSKQDSILEFSSNIVPVENTPSISSSIEPGNQSTTRPNNQSNNQPKRSVDWNKEVDHVFKEEIKDFANSFNNQNLSSWMK